jgi:putative FmdB family regulatory protein
MPIYEYICEDCGSHYEKIVLSKSQEISCPKCASRKSTLQLAVFATSTGSGNGASSRSARSTPTFSGGGGCCGGGSCGCQ